MKSPKKNISSSAGTGWGNVADWYEEHLASGDSYHQSLVLPNLLRLIGDIKGKKVLDLACGNGFFSKALAEASAEVTGLDISPELIAKAQLGVPASPSGGPTADFKVAPANKLPFDDKSFDAIINILAIDNISEVGEMLSECARVLKDGGQMHIVFNHPAFRVPKSSDWDFDEKRGVQYRKLGSYMSESKIMISMNPGSGNNIMTTTFHRPLQWYFKNFAKSGFAVSGLEEWISNKGSDKGPRQKAENKARSEFPLFLYIKLEKC